MMPEVRVSPEIEGTRIAAAEHDGPDPRRASSPALVNRAPERRIPTLQFVDSFHLGGAERQFINLVDGLRDSEFQVNVACFRAAGEFRHELGEDGPPLQEVRLNSLRSPRALLRLASMARFLIRNRIEIVHTINVYPNLFGVTAAWLAGTPVIVASVRDMGQVWSDGLRRAQKAVCRLADTVVTNAEAIAGRLRKEGYDPRRIEVIRNGIAAAAPSAGGAPLREELGLPADAILVGAVCRLHWVKRLEDFVDAAALLAPRDPRLRFLIVGPITGSPERVSLASELRERAAARGIADRVVFTGARSDVPRVLAELSVSVLPSLTEGLSNTLLESMAAGVPVVATAVGGNPEIVDHGVTGLLVPALAPAELAAAIARLLDDPALAADLGRAGRRRIERDFGCARMVDETRDLYRRLLVREGVRRPRWRGFAAPQRSVAR
jgi:glycosyltransferase involved in cell wall biosynthesis